MITQDPPPKHWGNGYTTTFSFHTKTHHIYKDGKNVGYAFNSLVDWAFIMDSGEFHAPNLPDGMKELIAREA